MIKITHGSKPYTTYLAKTHPQSPPPCQLHLSHEHGGTPPADMLDLLLVFWRHRLGKIILPGWTISSGSTKNPLGSPWKAIWAASWPSMFKRWHSGWFHRTYPLGTASILWHPPSIPLNPMSFSVASLQRAISRWHVGASFLKSPKQTWAHSHFPSNPLCFAFGSLATESSVGGWRPISRWHVGTSPLLTRKSKRPSLQSARTTQIKP